MVYHINKKSTVASYAFFNKFFDKMRADLCWKYENNTKAKKKNLDSSKNDTKYFWNNSPFKKLTYLFKALILKQAFWKTKTLFRTLEYRFVDAIAIIERAIFPNKATLLLLRQTKWGAKWTYPNERSLAINYFAFLENSNWA